MIQGILRVRLLNRRVGDHRARQIGVVTGASMILVIAWFTVPWLGASTRAKLLVVGYVWLVLMLAIEIAGERERARIAQAGGSSWQAAGRLPAP